MTNLTEQYQKGELPVGAYYVKYYNDSISPSIDIYRRNYSLKKESELRFTINQIEEVLADVPSYEQWIMTKNLSERAHLEMYKARGEKVRLEKENTKLKELLKECELWFTGVVGNMNDKNVGEHNRNLPIGNFEHIFKVFSQKINQVLGEE